MKKILIAGLLAATAIPASAATLTYSITDITTHAGFTTGNTGQSYTGTGFVGMYNSGNVSHLWGAEGASGSTANAQVDFSALSGKAINSATLSWVFLDGGGSYTVSITGFDSDGGLEYALNGPNAAYGSTTMTATSGANSVNVTSMVAAAAAGGEDWLGFNLKGLGGCCLYTYTNNAIVGGRNADSAQVRLTVNYDDVPEPAMLGLFGLGAIGLGLARRKRG